jgi:amidase
VTALHELTARELARRIRTRDVSAVEAVEAALARIGDRNASLNAVVSLDPELAPRSAPTMPSRTAKRSARCTGFR